MARFDTAGRGKFQPNPALTRISVAWEQETEYASQILFPTLRVGEQTNRYRIYPRKAFTPPPGGTVRAPGAKANEIEGAWEWSEDSYFAEEHSLEEKVTPEERDENPEQNVDADVTSDLTEMLLLERELAAVTLATTAANYKSDHAVTLAGTDQLDDYANSDPIGVFRTAIRTFHDNMLRLPNVAIIPWKVMSYLEDHPNIIARYQAQGGVITAEQIAAVLGLPRIVVPGGVYNSEVNPERTQSLSYMWGNNIIMAYVPPRPSTRTPAFGYEFRQPVVGGGRTQQNGVTVDSRWDDTHLADIHRARVKYDLKLVGRDPDLAGTPLIAGYLIKEPISNANF